MENLRYWNQLKTPPASALKPIVAGRLRGKSDINPQWRMQAMTEAFGPVGTGWVYTIDKLWTEPGTDNQVCAFALVSVKVATENGWSEPVPGIGGSMLIEKESKGLHTSDEAFKMAVTDGLSVAFKSFGVAADVYMGMLDGSKYNKPEAPRRIQEAPPKPEKIALDEVIKELEGAFSQSELAQIFKSRWPMAQAHYNKGEIDKLIAKKDEMKQQFNAA